MGSECEKPVKLNFSFRIFGYMKFDLVNSDLLREYKGTYRYGCLFNQPEVCSKIQLLETDPGDFSLRACLVKNGLPVNSGS